MDAIITVGDDQRVILFTAAAEQVFGVPRAQAIGSPLERFIPERFRAEHEAHMKRFAETGASSRRMGHQRIVVGLRADGEEFPIDASISQLTERGQHFYTVVLRDVSERVRGEQALSRSEQRLRGILDSAMDAIITMDERQHIVLFNAAAERVFGYSRDEVMGAPLWRLIPDRFRASHGAHVKSFGETGTTSRRMGTSRIVAGMRKNGEEFPIDASISQVEEHGHRFYTVILRDVTDRVRAERELRESREEIKEMALAANRVREQEKSRIARELHDELGQALTALKIDVVWMKQNLSAPTAELASKLTEMQLLVDGTVAATRRISADLRPLVLDDLGLAAAAEWLVQNFTQRTGVACELAMAADLELGEPHATSVFRALQESLTNIAKHAQATRVEVTLGREGGHVTLTVRDNGLGFDTQAPRKSGSFGLLGLRERAALLGGEATIDSEPGKGTRVELRL